MALKLAANLTQILNFKHNFHKEFEQFKNKIERADTLRLSAQ